MFSPLTELSSDALRTLIASLREGALARGFNDAVFHQIVGSSAPKVRGCLSDLSDQGFSANQIATALELLLEERKWAPDLASLFDLVLSGPEVSGAPTADTGAVILGLIHQAQREIMMVTYALHNTGEIFEQVAKRQERISGLCVKLYAHISRPDGDKSSELEIVRRFQAQFRAKHWPWSPLPEVYFDPRGMKESFAQRASLHGKCVVIDHKAALVTSANFTEAARTKNIELGVVVRHPQLARRITDYFEGLVSSGNLSACRW